MSLGQKNLRISIFIRFENKLAEDIQQKIIGEEK